MAYEEIAPQRKEQIVTDVLRYRKFNGEMTWRRMEILYKGDERKFAKLVNSRLDQAQLEIAPGGIIREFITLAEDGR